MMGSRKSGKGSTARRPLWQRHSVPVNRMEFLGYLQCPHGGAKSHLRVGAVGQGLSGDTGLSDLKKI